MSVEELKFCTAGMEDVDDILRILAIRMKWLEQRGVAYTERPIKEERPSADELRAWQKASGLPLKKFFNTSGQLYKALQLKDKLPAMSEEEQLALLATDGMLVKRPILIGDGFVLVGFQEAECAQTV